MKEKFPGNTVEGIPGGGRTDLKTYRATWGWMPAKTVLRDLSLMDTQLWVGNSVWWRRKVSMWQAKPSLNHGSNGGLLSENCASQTLLWGAPRAACTFVHEDAHHDLIFKSSFPCVYLWCASVPVHIWRSEANLGCWSSPSALLEASLLALYCVHQAGSSGSIQGFSYLHLPSC